MASAALNAQTQDRLPKDLDFAQARALPNHHPQWANAGNDAGLLPSGQLIDQMTLVLARSPQQEQAFESFLAAQQDPASPDYHHWLAPDEIGQRFGLSDGDIATLRGWLESQGLHVNWIAPSRIFIGFGGTAAEIGRAFQTELHTYRVNGAERMSVSTDPMIPAGLLPAIKAIRGLYTIRERPAHHVGGISSASPQLNSSSGNHYIAPGDFAVIYDLPTNYTGAGQTIGIVGEARTDFADFENFRSQTGTTFANPTEIVPTGYGGVDPGPALTAPPSGKVDTGLQGEATLDVTRAGSIAQGSPLLLVVASEASGGIADDAQYLVETKPVPAQVMSISFSDCESDAQAAGVNFWNTIFQQAAGEGISVFVASGDSGASGCDDDFTTPPVSPVPNSPNSICSSSYATCVGGTEFNDAGNPSNYWNSAGGNYLESAYGYIPEGAWNEPSTSNSSPQVASSGGGVSSYIPTPTWQTATGVPAARAGRYTPDVAFSASCHDSYFMCFAAGGAGCVVSNGSFSFEGFCGTSAAAPSMAGIAALLDQKQGAPQGNLNQALYVTSAVAPVPVIHDVTVATSGVANCSVNVPSMCNNSIPGASEAINAQPGYLITTGYDEATGLGSLDVQEFFDFYVTKFTPTVTVTVSSPSVGVQQAWSVTVSVAGGSGDPTPTGTVTSIGGIYSPVPATLVGGAATIQIPAGAFPPGQYALVFQYTPDTASSSIYNTARGTNYIVINGITPVVTITFSPTSATTAQTVTATVTVAGGSGNPTPTGRITLEGGGYSGSATLSGGSATFNIAAGQLIAGNDSLTASYTPDSQGSLLYNATSNSNSITVTSTALLTPSVSVNPSTTIVATEEPLPVTIVVSGGSGNPTPTGTVMLIDGAYSSPTATLSGGTASITIPANSLAQYADSLVAVYTPDAASASVYNNTSGSTTISVFNVAESIPLVSFSPSAPSITTTQALSLTVFVAGNGSPFKTTGSVTLSGGGYTSAPAVINASCLNCVVFAIPAGSLNVGTDTLTASYTPDAASSAIFYPTSNTVNVTVTTPVPPSFTIAGTSVTVAPGATTGNTSAITISPVAGFTGSVALTAAITSSPTNALYPPTLSFGATSPVNITSAGNGTATLTITTTAATNASLYYPLHRSVPWYAAGSAALGCILLFGFPARRRRVRTMLGMLALLAILGGGMLACGSGSSGGGGGGGGNSGTTAGTYTVTVTGTSGSTTEQGTVSLTIE